MRIKFDGYNPNRPHFAASPRLLQGKELTIRLYSCGRALRLLQYTSLTSIDNCEIHIILGNKTSFKLKFFCGLVETVTVHCIFLFEWTLSYCSFYFRNVTSDHSVNKSLINFILIIFAISHSQIRTYEQITQKFAALIWSTKIKQMFFFTKERLVNSSLILRVFPQIYSRQ